MTLSAPLWRLRTCIWMAAGSIPWGVIRAIFLDVLCPSHPEDNGSTNHRETLRLHDQLIFTPRVTRSHAVKNLGAVGGEDVERARDRPNDSELRWAGKLRCCARGNDASKPLRAGLLIPLASAVGTDAENKQYRMETCGTVCRNGLLSNPQMPVVFYAHAVLEPCCTNLYQRFNLQLLFKRKRSSLCGVSVVLEEEVSFSGLGIANWIQLFICII